MRVQQRRLSHMGWRSSGWRSMTTTTTLVPPRLLTLDQLDLLLLLQPGHQLTIDRSPSRSTSTRATTTLDPRRTRSRTLEEIVRGSAISALPSVARFMRAAFASSGGRTLNLVDTHGWQRSSKRAFCQRGFPAVELSSPSAGSSLPLTAYSALRRTG